MTFPRPRPEILDIAPYVGGESTIPGANRVIKLSSNEGAFGVPPGAAEAFRRAATEQHRYPDGSAAALRRALGRTHGLDPERIICGAGSDDMLIQLALAYGGPGTDLLMTEHGFSIYRIAGQYAGSRVVEVRERNLTTDVDALLAAVTPATRSVFIANPNNPTGTYIPAREVERLRAGLPPDVLLVLDAAYAEYVDAPDYEAGVALVDAGQNTVMTRTFSKVYGLGGARVGWCYAPSGIADVLNRIRSPFNVSVGAQAAAIAALEEPDWVERSRKHNTVARARLTHLLREAGITVVPSQCNFVLADFGSTERADAALAFLRARGLIVRGVKGYRLPHCLRITIGTDEEVGLVAEACTAFMRGHD